MNSKQRQRDKPLMYLIRSVFE